MISIVATSRTPIPDESLSGYEVLVRSRPQQWRRRPLSRRRLLLLGPGQWLPVPCGGCPRRPMSRRRLRLLGPRQWLPARPGGNDISWISVGLEFDVKPLRNFFRTIGKRLRYHSVFWRTFYSFFGFILSQNFLSFDTRQFDEFSFEFWSPKFKVANFSKFILTQIGLTRKLSDRNWDSRQSPRPSCDYKSKQKKKLCVSGTNISNDAEVSGFHYFTTSPTTTKIHIRWTLHRGQHIKVIQT